ncbi:MAG: hypothetical protein Q7U10_01870 [Thermodesulfovibrionia bacterium]|nr:hypothetical protein [Thermodesulfovibrionia bacterium]
MKIIFYTIIILANLTGISFADEIEKEKYVDVPYFNLLPYNTIEDAFKVFGKSRIYETKLAHNFVQYYDPQQEIEIIFALYGWDNKIWTITIHKTDRYKGLSNDSVVEDIIADTTYTTKVGELTKTDIKEPLTQKGIRLNMTKEEIDKILGTKIDIKDNTANIGWETRQEGNEVTDYGGINLTFNEGRLISIAWYGVDP